MQVTVNALKLAEELAKVDTITHFIKGTSNRVSREDILNLIENNKEIPLVERGFHPIATLNKDILSWYQQKTDYYFEIITNHAL